MAGAVAGYGSRRAGGAGIFAVSKQRAVAVFFGVECAVIAGFGHNHGSAGGSVGCTACRAGYYAGLAFRTGAFAKRELCAVAFFTGVECAVIAGCWRTNAG